MCTDDFLVNILPFPYDHTTCATSKLGLKLLLLLRLLRQLIPTVVVYTWSEEQISNYSLHRENCKQKWHQPLY